MLDVPISLSYVLFTRLCRLRQVSGAQFKYVADPALTAMLRLAPRGFQWAWSPVTGFLPLLINGNH